jgi:hypothetical protein
VTVEIHTSDRGTFKKCRRRWDWVSPIRQNLRPKLNYQGVAFPLWFGLGIHKALELYYDPALKRDPEEVWNTWYHDSVRHIQETAPDIYNNDEQEFLDHLDLGLGMMRHYKQWASINDMWFEVIDTESNFSVPLGFFVGDLKMQPVHYAGRRDAIIRDLRNGRYGIIDHKTTSRTDEEFFVKLEMDQQCSGYLAATQREQSEYFPDFVVYNSLRKVYPKPPTLLYKMKNGEQIGIRGLSVNRQTESCTADMFLESVEEYHLEEWFDNDLKAQGYVQYLQEEGDNLFILRHTVDRNQHEINSNWDQVVLEAKDMTSNPRIYPNPSESWYCIKCPFRAPCLAMNDGSDYTHMLIDNYELNPRDDT